MKCPCGLVISFLFLLLTRLAFNLLYLYPLVPVRSCSGLRIIPSEKSDWYEPSHTDDRDSRVYIAQARPGCRCSSNHFTWCTISLPPGFASNSSKPLPPLHLVSSISDILSFLAPTYCQAARLPTTLHHTSLTTPHYHTAPSPRSSSLHFIADSLTSLRPPTSYSS